eukprot:jgi/Orpsp1_1/1180150/evm.model.c7180000072318.1
MMSRSNLHINSMKNRLNTNYSQSTYNIDGYSNCLSKNQIRGCSSKNNNYNVYNFTQSTSNLSTTNTNQFMHSYRRDDYNEMSHALTPKPLKKNSTYFDDYGDSDQEDSDQDSYNDRNLGKTSIIDSLNLDFISMESIASEKMLQKQQTNQSLLYNLDLCVNESSLFSMASTSVNSLFSKKTITSYILISRRPIFSIMQKCLIEIYLLAKYSNQKSKNNNLKKLESGSLTKFLKKGIIESFLAFLMHTIFLPTLNSPFTIEIELPFSKEILKIKSQNKTEIRPLYHPIFLLFQLLSINNIISIFTHMTLEKSVIFYSENPSILTAI